MNKISVGVLTRILETNESKLVTLKKKLYLKFFYYKKIKFVLNSFMIKRTKSPSDEKIFKRQQIYLKIRFKSQDMDK